MSERGFWNDNLLEIQKKYWESWNEISGKASVVEGASPRSPWEMALEHWWEAVSPAAPEMARDFMTRMMDQGKQFFRMAALFSGKAESDGQATDWRDLLNRLSDEFRSAGGVDSSANAKHRLHGLMGFWELPFDNWQHMALTLSLLQGDPFRNMRQVGWQADMDSLFPTSGLGYTREELAQQQKLFKLLSDYKRALQEYSQFFTDIGSETVKRLAEKLEQKSHKGELIKSARALYDTCVESCEEVYGERVRTTEYIRINGQLVNTFMGVKHQVGVMVDANLGALNMPTRRELRTLQARMQEDRRECRRLRAELELLKGQAADPPAIQTGTGRKAATIKRKIVSRKKCSVES